MNEINQFKGEFRFLSNFYPAPVTMDGVEYPSTEHAYQAAKCKNPITKQLFITREVVNEQGNIESVPVTAGEAKALGRKVEMRPDWEKVKVGIMFDLVFSKFTQHEELKKQLMDTGDTKLVEGNLWHDTFWGKCMCKNHQGDGQNMLGRILMGIRAFLHNQEKCSEFS